VLVSSGSGKKDTHKGVEFILANPTAEPTARPASSIKSMESSLMMELTLIFLSTKDFLRKEGRIPLVNESNPPP
jgi:hypothetical protein